MFSTLDRRIILDYEVKTLSDMHIGARESTAPVSVDNPVLKDSGGHPIVPGSSVKGVLRSELEKLLRAHLNGDEKAAKERTAELFGGTIGKESYASSIKVRDAMSQTTKTLVRDGVRIDPKTRKASPRGRFDLEVVPKGVTFRGKIVIENPGLGGKQYAKLGALLATLGFFNATNSSLGGASSRGYGEVEISITGMREFTKEDYVKANREGQPLDTRDWDRYIRDWQQYMDSIANPRGDDV